MNYLSIYNSIIKSAKNQGRSKLKRDDPNHVYYEKHHIIPRCIMKDRNKEHVMNQKWNLVLLTAREHFICHRLLTKISKGSKYYYKMMYAFCAFIRVTKFQKRLITSHQYRTLKEVSSIASSYRSLNMEQSTRDNITHKTRERVKRGDHNFINNHPMNQSHNKLKISKSNKFRACNNTLNFQVNNPMKTNFNIKGNLCKVFKKSSIKYIYYGIDKTLSSSDRMRKFNPSRFRSKESLCHSAKKKMRVQVLNLADIVIKHKGCVGEQEWIDVVNKQAIEDGIITYIFSYDTYLKYKEYV